MYEIPSWTKHLIDLFLKMNIFSLFKSTQKHIFKMLDPLLTYSTFK